MKFFFIIISYYITHSIGINTPSYEYCSDRHKKGENCQDNCSPNCKDKICYKNGICESCQSGKTGLFCEESCPNNMTNCGRKGAFKDNMELVLFHHL